jgi:hypothetical protein
MQDKNLFTDMASPTNQGMALSKELIEPSFTSV